MTSPPWSGPVRALLPGGRLHLQHGPIDLVIEVCADDPAEARAAYEQAARRFETVLAPLAEELAVLRAPLGASPPDVAGPVAQRMVRACWPHRDVYVTPMAAVAGAVADEVLAALVSGRTLTRAYVNNGGDIALYLAAGQRFTVGMAGIEDARLRGTLAVDAASTERGIATSGWRGRSQSLGIADAVTVIARDAAAADAAATLVANAVNVDHPAVRRKPARALREDSDLGELLVTVAVGDLPQHAIDEALDSGERRARAMIDSGLIRSACLRLGHRIRIAGAPAASLEH